MRQRSRLANPNPLFESILLATACTTSESESESICTFFMQRLVNPNPFAESESEFVYADNQIVWLSEKEERISQCCVVAWLLSLSGV